MVPNQPNQMPDPVEQQSARDTIQETLAESVGMYTAVRAVGLEQHRRMMAASDKRVNDSHVLQMRTLGYDAEPVTEDEMGDISVAGDTHNHTNTVAAPQSKISKLAPVALLAAAAAIGIPLAIGAWQLPKMLGDNTVIAPKIVAPGTDTDTTSTLRPDTD